MKWKYRRACAGSLQQVFGVPGYRPGQKAAASCLLSGRDLLCILPTGAGKSLCWQLPAVVHEGLTVVISPLIALMQDQLEGLQRRGIHAVTINSLMDKDERAEAERRIRTGEARIIFVSPERLETTAFLRLCRDCPLWLVVVDEAHCVVQWGNDFRPAYSRIGDFIDALPRRPVVCAMTATADEKMQRQIIMSLRLRWHRRVMLPVMRENLVYSVRTAIDPTGDILHAMSDDPCKTVVFCRSRARTEQLSCALRRGGWRAEHYHAGLTREERESVLRRFRTGEISILAATTAFGMGVDIPDVRRVIHDRLPESVIDLAQQSGRAGRDGLRAECIIFVTPEDILLMRYLFDIARWSHMWRPVSALMAMRAQWKQTGALLKVLFRETCIPAGIAACLGQRVPPCGCCSVCRGGTVDVAVPALWRMDTAEAEMWLLRWQRDAIARKRGLKGSEIMTGREMWEAVRTKELPHLTDRSAEAALQRMLDEFDRCERLWGF